MTTPCSSEALPAIFDSLTSAFQTLLTSLRAHRELQKILRQRLDFAANEYEKLIAADGSASEASVAASQVAKLLRAPLPDPEDPEKLDVVKKANSHLRRNKMANPKANTNIARCPVKHVTLDPEDMERDFTTPGVQGNLGCPFAKMTSDGQLHTPSSCEDPIAAEFHPDIASARSVATEQRPGQCPIRFLDQHSPEEVAQYFENHKHEIPRSHEICVRRYQGDETSVRQLDAKYGNLVNMIQGLGVKHKAYLPGKDRVEEQEHAPGRTVETWNDDVDSYSEPTPPTHEIQVEDEDARLSRFEKPLREIRVGESPSRPWGISVPPDKEPTPSALQSDAGVDHPELKPIQTSPKSQSRKCPVDHRQAATTSQTAPKEKDDTRELQNTPTQIIFNGPVFFGYSAEQVAVLLQNTNLGSTKPPPA
ncbi:hypothetical protein LTR84_006139 [Exophiala bonariae]|uniref:SP-RING-type domain-containing protein n=1 Tax=Exophiala bonariae TaxID=1690606 RepID=A0AAV9N2E3_9EURO|nr:hypothetical protein LTR84_006139 [Exophiala bonariae]